ncbi:hypothetical protein F0267_00660 [Vibrio coralliilyticus]|uniref:DNA replication terminus site-binding protein n=1 Tax=Vibrio coralliilyticus TaxID=190893 RepID=A0AAN0SIF5_9VIBR|nr:DNA replication terminus site-binding protein [Vibrio coralliilyticus]AIW22636.1 hypothetical protein IX92_26610 [Vibrio coralliilyticus]NOH36731.1 hypothetical protein [Vibrio coralliilyticus]PAW02252.1 hypothetical protein CKJ79_16455 [Vibrio coralliilyticus]
MPEVILDRDSIKKVETRLDEIDVRIQSLISFLMDGNVTGAKVYSVERTFRGEVNPTTIDVSHLTGGCALKNALDNYRIQYNEFGEPTVPKRVVGAIFVQPDAMLELAEKVSGINSAKDDLLTKLKKIASTPYMRTRYLKAARSGINITSIYRHINLAPDDVYRISHSWNDKQQSPQPKSVKEVEDMINTLDDIKDENGVITMSSQERIKIERAKLPTLRQDEEFIYVCGVKAHIEQIARYTTVESHGGLEPSLKRPRKIYKASSPLLVAKSLCDIQTVKFVPPVPYNRPKDMEVEIKYDPVLPHLNIYKRTIQKRKDKNATH